LLAIRPRWRAIGADRAGGATIVFALTLPVIVGFAGLGAEAASWYLAKRNMQGAADTAAAAAATALAAGTTSAAALANEGRTIAARSGFVNGSNSTTVTVNYPPTSGSYQGRADAVAVSITRQEPALLSALFQAHGPSIAARAVAFANLSYEACVIALDKNNETAMTTSGNPNLSFPSCSLYANSPAAAALNLNGSATISANKAYFVGNYSGSGLTTSNGVYRGVDPIADPYRTIAVPAYAACDVNNNYSLSGGKSDTKNVGASGVYVFCKGVKLTGNSSLTLGPGTFIIDGGDLEVTSGSITATGGTTIILTTKLSGQPCAKAKITSGPINITAPTSGSLAGIAIYKDRSAACVSHDSNDDKVTGNSAQNIVGAIYFPEQYIDYSGGSAAGGAVCTQLIAWKIQFTGNSGFQNNCTGTGARQVSLNAGRLVE
jgi:Flp pilus assembly protein TadG